MTQPEPRPVTVPERAPTLDDLLSLTYTISADGHRASALADLVPHVDETQLATLLSAAYRIDEEYQQYRVLAEVAKRASADQLAEIAGAVWQFTLVRDWMFGLVMLVPHLDGERRADVVAEALNAIDECGCFYFVSEMIPSLAPYLSPAQLDRALGAAVQAVEKEGDRLTLLGRLESLRPVRSWAEAITTASTFVDGGLRARALVALARRAPGEHLDALLAAVGNVREAGARVRALAAFVPYLPEQQRQLVIDDAYAALPAPADNDPLRHIALRDLLPLLTHDQIAGILAGERSAGGVSLRAVAPYVAPETLAAALDAVIAPTGLGDPLAGPWLGLYHEFADLIAYLPADHRNAAARSAVSLRDQIGAYSWGQRLASVAEHLTPAQLDEVLAMITPDTAAGTAVEHLAPHLDHAQLGKALSIVIAVDKVGHRGEGLAKLAPHLTGDHLDHLITAVLALPDPATLTRTLVQVLPHAPADRQDALIRAALSTAATITSAEDRASCLLDLAAAAPAPYRTSALSRAYTAMTTITDTNAQSRMVGRTVELIT